MKTSEMKHIMKRLGLQQLDLAAITGKSTGGIRKWDSHYGGVVQDQAVVVLLRLLDAQPDLLPMAWVAAGLPNGRK